MDHKRSLFVIQEHFNASEYGEPRAILERKGVAITVAAASREVVTAYAGEMVVQPDVSWSQANAADYDVLVFVGGYPYDADDPQVQQLVRDAVAEGKLVAGICNAAIAMAKAGVLEGKRVTALTYHPASELENEGAVLTDATVERDGLFISGNGPDACVPFGAAIAEALGE
jgi:putative intracellular protease/amidase